MAYTVHDRGRCAATGEMDRRYMATAGAALSDRPIVRSTHCQIDPMSDRPRHEPSTRPNGLRVRCPAFPHVHRRPPVQVTVAGGPPWTVLDAGELQLKLQRALRIDLITAYALCIGPCFSFDAARSQARSNSSREISWDASCGSPRSKGTPSTRSAAMPSEQALVLR